MKSRKIVALLLTVSMISSVFTGCGSDETKSSESTAVVTEETNENSESTKAYDENDAWEKAAHETYAPYPETVNYTIGITVDPSKTYPEGWENPSPEHSAYTDFYKAKINVQNTDFFEAADGDDYKSKVSMAIASGEIPDL